MNCATAASTQALVTALLLQVSNDCVDAAADVLAVVLCRCLFFPACSSRRQFLPLLASAATTPWEFLPGQLCMLLHLGWDSEVLADAGGTAAEISESWHLASGIS